MKDATSTPEPTRKSPGVYARSPVETLICDAVILAQRAVQEEMAGKGVENEVLGALVRGSVLSAAFAVEAVANCCLERGLDFPNRLQHPLERLRTLEKFDLYLHLLSRPLLDRGRLEVQRVEELGRIRNGLVHPLVFEQKAEIHHNSRMTAIHPDFGKEVGTLSLPEFPRRWMSGHAISVLRAVFEFLDHFFTDLCRFDSHRTTSIINDKLEMNGGSKTFAGPLYEAAFEASRSWNIRPRCLKWLYDEMKARGAPYEKA